MSVRMSARVWQHGPVRPCDRLMMLALADFADATGYCWPGVETLAQMCGVERRAAQRTLRRLEADGWVATQTGGGKASSRYRLNLVMLSPGGVVDDAGPGASSTTSGGVPQDAKGRRAGPEQASSATPEPSGTTSNSSVNRQPPPTPKGRHENEKETPETSKTTGCEKEALERGGDGRPTVASLRAKVEQTWPGTRMFSEPSEAHEAWSAIHHIGAMGGLHRTLEEAAREVEFAITAYRERVEGGPTIDLIRQHQGAEIEEETA